MTTRDQDITDAAADIQGIWIEFALTHRTGGELSIAIKNCLARTKGRLSVFAQKISSEAKPVTNGQPSQPKKELVK